MSAIDDFLERQVLAEAADAARHRRRDRWFSLVIFVVNLGAVVMSLGSVVAACLGGPMPWTALVLLPFNGYTMVSTWRSLRRGPFRHMVLLRRDFGYDESEERGFVTSNFRRWHLLTADFHMLGSSYRVYTFPREKDAALFKLFFG